MGYKSEGKRCKCFALVARVLSYLTPMLPRCGWRVLKRGETWSKVSVLGLRVYSKTYQHLTSLSMMREIDVSKLVALAKTLSP